MQMQRSVAAVDGRGMTPPRCIHQNTWFYVTVRAVNRSFRFVPKKEIRKAIRYALSVTLQEYRSNGKLVLCEWVFLSNHYHFLGIDHEGCLPDFIRDLNSLISRQLNALRGISGANIEKGYNLVEVHSAERFVEHAVYTLANPVRAFLVATTKDWKDMSSFGMQYGRPVTVERPTSGLWAGKVAHRSRRASNRSGRAKYAGD
jgi:REP element-mobilizing transposase RayT